MNSQERLEALFRGELPDRVPIIAMGLRPHWKAERFLTSGRIVDSIPIWPNDPGNDPSIERVLEYCRSKADLLLTWGPPPNIFWSALESVSYETQTLASSVEGYQVVRTICHAPAGDLVHEEYVSSIGLPPYTGRRFVQNEDELEIFLSIPDRSVPVDGGAFGTFRASLPDDCCFIVMPGFCPATMLYDLIDPDTFLIWSRERRTRLLDIVEMLAARRLRLVRDMVDAGIGTIYQTSGHEDFIPPMMHPEDLYDFVLKHDIEFSKLLHERDCWAFCHCHGRVNAFLEQFRDVGIDALHPLEPPPMGDTDFGDAKRRVGERMVLWGNIQTHDLMTLSEEEVRQMTKELIETGKPGGRFCLSPTAELVVGPTITAKLERNIIAMIETALEYGQY